MKKICYATVAAAGLLVSVSFANAALVFVETDTAKRTEAFDVPGFATLPVRWSAWGSAISPDPAHRR